MEVLLSNGAMLVATTVCALLPVLELLKGRLRLRNDVLFILFWYQSWVYVHVIPTINGLIPDSGFALPATYSRVIQFTPSTLAWYAAFEVAILVLFHVPFLLSYLRFRGRSRLRAVAIQPPKMKVALGPLIGLAVFYAVFGAMFYEVAWRTGLASPYGNSIELLAGLSRYDHWVWRMYIITGPFLLTIVMLGCVEHRHDHAFIPLILTAAPGVVINLYWVLSSSRATVALLIMGVGAVSSLRSSVRKLSSRAVLIVGGAAIVFVYGLSVIPNFRAIVLDEQATAEDYVAALNPFDSNHATVSAGGGTDYGFRLDGLELMVLATPKMMERGPLPLSRYTLAILSPVVPLVPALERRLKFEERALDLKQYIMAEYTDISTPDYPSGALADIFMAMGPPGFLVAGVTYGWIFAWLRRLIVTGSSGSLLILGVFLYYNVALYEFAFASLPLGWVRGLPVLLIALALNPFAASGQQKFRRRRIHPLRWGRAHDTSAAGALMIRRTRETPECL